MGTELFDVISKMPQHEAALGAVVPSLDAATLVTQCARHGLSAYVADAFARVGVVLPAPHQQRLTDDARAAVGAGAKNRRLLMSVLDALARKGLTPIVLKGYGLASRVYPSPLVRPSTDVDVLVLPSELPRVHEAMTELGLVHHVDAALGDVLEDHHHESFAGAAGLVEVHFRLFAGLGMATYDDEAVQARAWSSTLEGRAVRYLSAEDEFLYLSVHAANHAFLRASWLVDLQLIALKSPPNWQRVAALAREVGFTVPYAAALDAARVAVKAPVPDSARRAVGHWHVRRVVHSVLFSPENVSSAVLAEGRVAPFLIRLWLVDSAGRGALQLLSGAQRFARREVTKWLSS